MLQLSPPLTAPATRGKSFWRWIKVRGRWIAAALLAVVATVARAAPVQYVTAPVARGAVTRAVTATGTVNPVFGTYVSGVIQNLYCDYNTQVRANQVCAKIDPRPSGA